MTALASPSNSSINWPSPAGVEDALPRRRGRFRGGGSALAYGGIPPRRKAGHPRKPAQELPLPHGLAQPCRDIELIDARLAIADRAQDDALRRGKLRIRAQAREREPVHFLCARASTRLRRNLFRPREIVGRISIRPRQEKSRNKFRPTREHWPADLQLFRTHGAGGIAARLRIMQMDVADA